MKIMVAVKQRASFQGKSVLIKYFVLCSKLHIQDNYSFESFLGKWKYRFSSTYDVAPESWCVLIPIAFSAKKVHLGKLWIQKLLKNLMLMCSVVLNCDEFQEKIRMEFISLEVNWRKIYNFDYLKYFIKD